MQPPNNNEDKPPLSALQHNPLGGLNQPRTSLDRPPLAVNAAGESNGLPNGGPPSMLSPAITPAAPSNSGGDPSTIMQPGKQEQSTHQSGPPQHEPPSQMATAPTVSIGGSAMSEGIGGNSVNGGVAPPLQQDVSNNNKRAEDEQSLSAQPNAAFGHVPPGQSPQVRSVSNTSSNGQSPPSGNAPGNPEPQGAPSAFNAQPQTATSNPTNIPPTVGLPSGAPLGIPHNAQEERRMPPALVNGPPSQQQQPTQQQPQQNSTVGGGGGGAPVIRAANVPPSTMSAQARPLTAPQTAAPPPPAQSNVQAVAPSNTGPRPPNFRPPTQVMQQPPNQPAPVAPAPGGGGGGGGPRPGGPVGGMRELRVEDALLYLDDVKREFGDRPRIYNEFLEIMKNFKSQEVDTPGVIARVSKLFRGYNNLILGFNKFLPEGYKIGLADIERANREHERQEAEAAAAAAAAAAAGQQQRQQPPPGYYPGGQQQPPQTASAPGVPRRSPDVMQAQRGGPPQMGGAARPGPGQPQNFGNRLPGGPPPQGAPMGRPGTGPMQPGPPQQQHQQQGGPPQPLPPHPPGPPRGVPPQQQQQQQPPQQQPPQQHQAVEFDHAISYVTNIKKRFAQDPSTYHSFLEILHTYQKEQRGIKEVLEQVAALFADHPDLLKEFTFFLPDAVQEQAKERLHRAAAESESRQAMMLQEQGGHYANQQAVQPSGSQKVIDMTGRQRMAEAPLETSQSGRSASRKRALDGGAPVMPMHPPTPESFVYNSAVERQFFDAAKEALTSYTRDGGQAWAEFLKCLELYSQEILSKSEMLNFVEPLLGKRNVELFEEFKRILTAAGAQSGPAASMEDAWYSVPLSEIDFSRCRRCSPSYRALPRDYPAPPCSDRNEEEARVLNDVWVSLPVGSEESYTFRHMRRNQHEEVLFRCEDERFEIDMVIDSNAATMHRLEPIAEEISQLSKEELITPDLVEGKRSSTAGVGMGGKRYQYTFDHKRTLGVIHRNAIARIYGDSGQEMLDLMVKNPTVAIPVVLKRLQQKDREWRAARSRLNIRWKELAEMNYYKSLDHRSLTWRTTDKRATSTRTLVAEIKDRAQNDGNEGDAAVAARREKAKEEHGTFYAVTMGDTLTRKLDLTHLPKPDPMLFTPHLSLTYENVTWAQRDAYRLLTFAIERGSTSPNDKEGCHSLLREFLGPWFGLSLNWMQRPAVDYHTSPSPFLISNGSDGSGSNNNNGGGDMRDEEDDDESSEQDENEIGNNVVTEELKTSKDGEEEKGQDSTMMGHHPLPAGARVSTTYGEGVIIQFRRADKKYIVRMPFGTASLQPNAVLCSVVGVEKSGYTMQLRADDQRNLERREDMLAIGTQSLYLFFRLHQILIRRLNIAKEQAYRACTEQSLCTIAEQMVSDNPNEDLGKKRYDAYLSLVYALVEGGYSSMSGGSSSSSSEGGRYEDRVRSLLGHGAYELATMDKLISHLVKNIQHMSNDDTMKSLTQLYRRHLDAGSFKPEALRQEAAYLSDGNNMYAFQYCLVPHTDKAILHTEHLGVISDTVVSEGENGESEAQTSNNNNVSEGGGGEFSSTNTKDVTMKEADVIPSGSGDNSDGGPSSKRRRKE